MLRCGSTNIQLLPELRSGAARGRQEEDDMTEERRIVAASDSGITIRSFNDIPDAVGACLGKAGLILIEDDLSPEFFDLSSGLAGELLQKLVNYKVRTAIIVLNPEAHGERFRELAYEHRSHPMIRFFRFRDEADAWLGG
jgi:Domain of unknown function (DUF4180)